MIDYNLLFDKIVSEVIERYLELNPAIGTSLGLHEYDSLVARMDRKWYDTIEKL